MTKLCEVCGCSFDTKSIRARWCATHRPSRSDYLKEWSAANSEHKKAAGRAYYRDKREEFSSYAKSAYLENRQAYLDRAAKAYQANPENSKVRIKEWQQKNKAKVDQYKTKYAKANPEKALARWHLRKARILGSPSLEHFDRTEIFDRDNWTCQLCGQALDKSKKKPHPMSPSIDHIVPLARGGEHTKQNCQSAHLGCNRSKGAKAA